MDQGSPFGLEANLLGGKAWLGVFDNSKLRCAVPDYRPRVCYDEGIHETVAYILTHPEHHVGMPLRNHLLKFEDEADYRVEGRGLKLERADDVVIHGKDRHQPLLGEIAGTSIRTLPIRSLL